jgi:ribosomal protein S3
MNNEMLMAIVGQFDQNLKNLSKLTNTMFFLEETQLHAKEIKKIYLFFVKQ